MIIFVVVWKKSSAGIQSWQRNPGKQCVLIVVVVAVISHDSCLEKPTRQTGKMEVEATRNASPACVVCMDRLLVDKFAGRILG